ncbi:hypothetical protein FNH05_17540 [Amycolatopsis rhizosphaerae]|uniref:Uncharacterized protein n=1 Tax=Amycolatopsis rhizosphaerae TaxID=2053003 RepID=A0A558CJC3_9PSEU|nr:hypothetical protein [Amycolatopsis rhizosphaerae]TVT48822.1 hypothetical protein FNH05_17540 [Amycolatopsis rhizosphaerae]
MSEPGIPTGQTPEPVAPPTPVRISFVLWVVSGVLLIVNYVLVLLYRQRIVDEYLKTNKDPRVNRDNLTHGVTIAMTLALIAAVCVTALLLLFAWKARQGTRSARTVVTALYVAVVVVQLLTGLLSSLFTELSALLGFIALLLMYLPKVSGYFPKVGRTLP